ncbi:thioredoxin domain-containing protein [Cohnella lubricantis]|uniref:Thioredoxin domain-containing protein n=1 Tax=Cohnella lubricantis TaxID=2163172 RepID=A0A841TB82_9BACL|nr:thioredoxin domain-containing protein [Cohnella lubricantis]MBB6678723.1 thioredoxin domain-containing protein [Cohnella lubricantis]MBP2119791.1 protein-disulfide isomerase [Cohnella lubricantis]
MQKAQSKAEIKKLRQQQELKRKRNKKILVWSTVVVVVALIVFAFVFQPKPKPIAIDYDQVPTLGSADAKVKLAEFVDFKCPTCQAFSLSILPEIKKDYVDKGLVSISFLNYPIISPESDSTYAALAAQSVFHQNEDEFWKYYDALFQNQQDERTTWATPEYLVNLAKNLKLQIDYDTLKSDIDNQTYKDEVDAQYELASSHRFPGTPTVLLNGVQLTDKQALDTDRLKAEIDKALKEAE